VQNNILEYFKIQILGFLNFFRQLLSPFPLLSTAGLHPQNPVILDDFLQLKLHYPYNPLLRKQMNTDTTTALTAETH